MYADEDLIDFDDEDFIVPPRGNGSAPADRADMGNASWTGPSRPNNASNGQGKVEKGDEWYDVLEGSGKISDIPSYISPGELHLRN